MKPNNALILRRVPFDQRVIHLEQIMSGFIGLILGFFIGICFVSSMGGRIITEGINGQPDTVRKSGVTYILVKAKIEEDK